MASSIPFRASHNASPAAFRPRVQRVKKYTIQPPARQLVYGSDKSLQFGIFWFLTAETLQAYTGSCGYCGQREGDSPHTRVGAACPVECPWSWTPLAHGVCQPPASVGEALGRPPPRRAPSGRFWLPHTAPTAFAAAAGIPPLGSRDALTLAAPDDTTATWCTEAPARGFRADKPTDQAPIRTPDASLQYDFPHFQQKSWCMRASRSIVLHVLHSCGHPCG